jgi:hypothetical protein
MLDQILITNGPEIESNLVLLNNNFNSAKVALIINPRNGNSVMAANDDFDLKKNAIDEKIRQIRNILSNITSLATRIKSRMNIVSANTRAIIVLYK